MSTQKSVVTLDAGNSVIKSKIARRERGEIDFPLALKPLTETEYENILSRSKTSGLSPDFCGSMASRLQLANAPNVTEYILSARVQPAILGIIIEFSPLLC
jgi:hypothetical protein